MTLDLTNKKFGRWTPIKRDVLNRKNWNCICECGVEKSVYGADLRGGKSLSCGCLRGEQVAERNKANATHGMFGTRTYRAYHSMLNRCYNPNYENYLRYGGRGILVCAGWKDSFDLFFHDMGEAPEGASMGRIDNNQGYSAGNCRWESAKEQANNRSSSVFIEHNGERKTLIQWSEETGIRADTLSQRIFKLKWSTERAFSTNPDQYLKRGQS